MEWNYPCSAATSSPRPPRSPYPMTFSMAPCLLGICDKIVPGLVIGALTFGHLPMVFVPAGPMPTGIGNAEKNKVRQAYAQGKATRDDLLPRNPPPIIRRGPAPSSARPIRIRCSWRSWACTCPGRLSKRPARQFAMLLPAKPAAVWWRITAGPRILPVGEMIDERSFVNAIVGLLATGGSTNHTLHLIPMARAAGIHLGLAGFQRPFACRALARQGLPERLRRCERVPPGRRHGLRHP